MTREDRAIEDLIDDLIDQLVHLRATKHLGYQTNPLVPRIKVELEILLELLD